MADRELTIPSLRFRIENGTTLEEVRIARGEDGYTATVRATDGHTVSPSSPASEPMPICVPEPQVAGLLAGAALVALIAEVRGLTRRVKASRERLERLPAQSAAGIVEPSGR